jgi:hypothetical protein
MGRRTTCQRIVRANRRFVSAKRDPLFRTMR